MNARLLIALLAAVLLVSCGHRTDRMATNNAASVAANSPLAGSMVVGDVSGGNTLLVHPEGISDDEFKEALEKSLTLKGYFATDASSARYRIDAAMDFDAHVGFNSTPIDGTVTYTVYSLPDNRKILEQKIASAFTGEGQNTAVQFLFTGVSAYQNGRREGYEKAATDNLASFMNVLSQWSAAK